MAKKLQSAVQQLKWKNNNNSKFKKGLASTWSIANPFIYCDASFLENILLYCCRVLF